MSSAGTKWWRKAARTFVVTALIATSVIVGFSTPAQAKALPTVINLLTVNDFHGRINATTVDFAKTIEKLRQDSLLANDGIDNTLLVGAGDFIGASEFASDIRQDQPTIDVFNELGLNVSALGNHEFDKGREDLDNRVIAGGTNASWDYLGANVYKAGTTDPAYPAYKVYEVNGISVGVIGVVTQETPTLVSPAGVASLTFGDPVDAINRVTNDLKDGNPDNGEADIVIATMHEGAPAGTSAGGTLQNQIAVSAVFNKIVTQTDPRVAAIINGHTHQAYAWDAPVPGAAADVTRPIIQTGSYASNVGQIQLTVDADTDAVLGYSVANVERLTGVTFDPQYPEPASIAAVTTTVNAALAYAAEVGNRPIGSVTADITTAFTGGSYVNGIYTASSVVGGVPQGRDNRSAESALGNVVADALLSSMAEESRGGAEITLVNPGGLRSELFYAPDGSVTYAEANGVLPFVNNLGTIDLTGAQVVNVLEEQWQTDATGLIPSRQYLQLGTSANMSYTYASDPDGDGIITTCVDKAIPRAPIACDANQNLIGGSVWDDPMHITTVTIDGQPIDPAATYRVGTFAFVIEGGDNFREFLDGTNYRDSGLIDRDAWIQYISDNSPLAPSFDKHAVEMTNIQVNGQPVDTLNTVKAGDTVSLDLSNLNLTSLGAPENTSVDASFVSTLPGLRAAAPVSMALGSFPVAGGAATISFDVPLEADGRHYLVLENEISGLSFKLPFDVIAAAPAIVPPPPPPPPAVVSPPPPPLAAPVAPITSAIPTLSSTGLTAGMVPATSWLAVAMILVGGAFLMVGRRRVGGRRH